MPFIIHISTEGIAQPRFQCDECGNLIVDANQAILVWNESSEHKTEDIVPRFLASFAGPVTICLQRWMELNSALVASAATSLGTSLPDFPVMVPSRGPIWARNGVLAGHLRRTIS